ncbi:hypothetical protein CVT26_012437 [Gymnopilus dilepis]|uniref:Sister chromatid cohesion protein n=1 Tax=Gymnopilus dilepis TaxID=231916 RepID=A0A409YW75_9AGAR|nr:hypothetical protein CVT26_012437 [Gymnopilus dilepis]
MGTGGGMGMSDSSSSLAMALGPMPSQSGSGSQMQSGSGSPVQGQGHSQGLTQPHGQPQPQVHSHSHSQPQPQPQPLQAHLQPQAQPHQPPYHLPPPPPPQIHHQSQPPPPQVQAQYSLPPPPPPQKTYHPSESDAFFDDFLQRKVEQMNAAGLRPRTPPASAASAHPPGHTNTNTGAYSARQDMGTVRPVTPPRKVLQGVDESPDPLALRSPGSGTGGGGGTGEKYAYAGNGNVSVTPQKRKPVVLIESSPAKRMQLKALANGSGGSSGSGGRTLTQSSSTGSIFPQTPARSSSNNGKGSSLPPQTPSSKASSSVPSVPSTTHSLASTRSTDTLTLSTPKTVSVSKSKLVNRAYVAVPPSPYATPFSVRRGGSHDTPDLGGYGSDAGVGSSPTKRGFSVNDSVKSSARRTGDRDERGPLEKLTSLIEDLFEAEDNLPSEVDASELNHDFFSPLSSASDPSRPCLAPSLMRKLLKYIGHVARPSKRLRQVGGGGGVGGLGTPRGKGRMADVESKVLGRVLKMLERGVRAGEDLDPFKYRTQVVPPGTVSAKSSPKKASTKKGKGKKEREDRRSRSATPRNGNNNGDEGEGEDVVMEDASGPSGLNGSGKGKGKESVTVDAAELEKLSVTLEVARDSILAADCCIALLGSDRLEKQLYSEELITACLNTIKNQLVKILYPFVEASSESASAGSINPLLQSIIKSSSSSSSHSSSHASSHSHTTHSQTHRRLLSELFQALSAVIPRINNLINAEAVAMSDSIIIQAVYIAIGPFFVADGGGGGGAGGDGEGKKGKEKGGEKGESVVIKTLGRSAMRGVRLDALALIRSIFAIHEDQRSWIIEEILTSLIKLNDTKQKAGQFRLRDGRSIRTVSALLLQLVQTSAHDVRIGAKKLEKSRRENAMERTMRRQDSFSESQGQGQQGDGEPFLDEIDQEELRLYATSLDSATKAAKTIILFLTQRSGKGKATKNSNEAEYRAIFDNLIDDLLVVLFWPEWPAAGVVLSIASKFMVSSLDDVKSSSSQTQTDSNAAKTMALDHLGVIAARIRTSVLKFQKEAAGRKVLKPLDEIVSSVNLKALNRFLDAHQNVAAHLSKRSSEDQAYDSARELTAATLGYELAAALKQVHGWIESPEGDEDLNLNSNLGLSLKDKDPKKLQAFGQRLKLALREVWKDGAGDVFDIGSQEEVQRVDALAEEIGTIQSLRNSFNPILSVIVMALDAPAIFMRTKALRALGQIVTCDASVLSLPNVRRGIEGHLLDSSPAVRDAAVELIGKYMIDSPEFAGDYYQKIADRMADTGLSVRKRVIKLLKSFYPITDEAKRIDIATRLVLRMLDEDDSVKDLAIKTLEELWFPPTPLPSALKTRTAALASAPPPPRDTAALLSKVSVIMGTAANFNGRQSPLEDVLHRIMADKDKEGSESEKSVLHGRYAEICEALIDGLVDASDLPGFTVINCIRTIYLLTSAYPSILSGTNASTLLPYLKNATTPEEIATTDFLLKIFKILQEAVGCMCIVVQHLTHDFVRLVNLMKSCNARLQSTLRRPASQELSANDVRALLVLIFIVALLAENCNYDALRRDNPSLVADLNSISEGPITEHVYHTLLTLYEKHDNASLRGRILQCLGFLFRAQPTLMTMERSARVMDDIFASQEEEGKGRVLKIIQDFLVSEASKHIAKEKESTKGKSKTGDVNMEELIGNTDGFADSGVSSAVVQRYFSHILDAALSQNLQMQAVAIDILSFVIKQGLTHPMQSFPVIVALETSPVVAISNRASALHSILQGKHSTLVNTRFTVSARQTFDYQKKVCDGPVRGFRLAPGPVALLQRWYSHVREKRQVRQDFLKTLVRTFQESQSFESTQDDVNYMRYMAENFATFDYKTLEEVLTVIKFLTDVLSTTGMQLLEVISPSHLLSHLHGASQSQSQLQSQTQTQNQQEAAAAGPVEAAPKVKLDGKEGNKVAIMRTSVIIALVMLLKAHLKTLYSLSEEKCNKFVVGKKSALGDKPATKRHDNPISWDRLPFATTPLHTTEDAEQQKARFLEIWNEDGVSGEPEDEEFL